MKLSLPAALALATTADVAPVDAHYYASPGILVPHRRNANRYNRAPLSDPFDLAMGIFRTPIYDAANSLFRQSGSALEHLATSSSPRYAVTESQEDGTIELAMEVPGVAAQDLNIELEDNSLLRIQGARTLGQLKSEFDQTFKLHEEIDPASLKVTLTNGILKVVGNKKQKISKRLNINMDSADKDTEEEVQVNLKQEQNVEKADEVTAAGETVDGLTITEEDED